MGGNCVGQINDREKYLLSLYSFSSLSLTFVLCDKEKKKNKIGHHI